MGNQIAAARNPGSHRDITVGQALLLALFLFTVCLGMSYPHELLQMSRILEFLWNYHSNFIWTQGVALTLNLLAVGAVLSRVLEQEKQGNKLKTLVGKRQVNLKAILRQVLISIIVSISIFFFLHLIEYPNELKKYIELRDERFIGTIRLNIALAGQAIVFIFFRIIQSFNLKKKPKTMIPSLPEAKNEVVLGTVGEREGNPEWVTLSEKALFGGILNTTSVGGGKTEALIKPILKQLCKFEPRPAFLIIDPKSSIPKDVIQIVEECELSNHFLHMHLEGNVTFNPLYMKNALKSARFADIAEMISAAQVNFTGIGRKEDFWDSSSSNLVKHCIAYCAATQEYFTFNSVYQVIGESINGDEKLCRDLRECLNDSRFDEEEKHNIQASLAYFEKEFSQFDIKVKTGILATATSFLSQFQEYRASRIFCPKKEDLTLTSMDQVIDEGKILLFDITNPGLARAMGTFVKLHYQFSNLRRIKDPNRLLERPAVLIIDEYQDVVSTGSGRAAGDNTYTAKSREAKAINIVATQSISSIENAVGNEKAAKELLQNFRTKIAGHSTDLTTIKYFQELCGQELKEKITHSFSEQAQRPTRNLLLGGFDSKESNISESISTSEQKEYIITPQDFARLKTFECFAQVYDGIETHFKRLYLKPYYLKDKTTPQEQIWKAMAGPQLEQKATTARPVRKLGKAITTWLSLVKILTLICTASLDATFSFPTAQAEILFPNVCSVIRPNEFLSCFKPMIGAPCVCGFPPRPCLTISYYVPKYFVEVLQTPGSTFFGKYPEAIPQLQTISSLDSAGVDSDDSHFYQAHIIPVPLLREVLEMSKILPCGGSGTKMGCFRAMSEHLGGDWTRGEKDSLQPSFKMWSLAGNAGIKACLVKGAIDSFSTAADSVKSAVPFSMDEDQPLACSNPGFSVPPIYPPSRHGACNGWGVFYPRVGVYDGVNHVLGALQVAARLRSLASDVYKTMSEDQDEYWQIIKPQTSSCFREGEAGLKQLEFHERGRLPFNYSGGYLFAVWQKASCCADVHEFPKVIATVELALKAACLGVGL